MKGKWIWKDAQTRVEDNYAEFQACFRCNGERAFLHISADCEYAVFVNGAFVYGGQYADFPWYKVYDEIELTDYLNGAQNDCRIWVWYCGDLNFCHYVHQAGVCFSIVDEKGQTLCASGEGTTCRTLPYYVCGAKKRITEQIGYSFALDYTQKKETFHAATLVECMAEKLYKRQTPLLRILPLRSAKKVAQGVYDLGEECVGFPYLVCKGGKGKTFTVSFGEWLSDGRVVRRMGARDFSFTVTADGEQRQIIQPLRKLGCRYLQVEGEAEILQIGLLPQQYPFRIKDYSVLTGIENKIYQTSVYTLQCNALEHYYDCPWREQAFYALDSRMQMRYGLSAFENPEYVYAALQLMSEDRHPSGLLSIVVPTSHPLVIPSFALFYTVAMQEYASATGDTRLIERYFEKLKGITDVFVKNSKDGLLQNFQGDAFWNFYEWNAGLSGSSIPCDSALNFTFLLHLNSLIEICSLLKKETEKAAYLQLYAQIAQRINERFYDEKEGLYRLDEKEERIFALVNAYAVLTGVANEERSKFICEQLTQKEGGMVACTLSMQSFVYDALLKTDKQRYAPFILQDIRQAYGYMLQEGATTFWETLKGSADFDGAGSLCHGWSALPVYYYRKLLLGE